ncbi:MAG: DUF309 domain-containing protein [Ignavibacteria bacterium]|nr:DUF309 domain-containing protein [Ignavibacteria bacterium]
MNKYIRSKFICGIETFNKGKFLEAHEIFEDIWLSIRDKTRDFYQGLVHISVASYHLNEKNNLTGAMLQFRKAKLKLEKYLNKKYENLPEVDIESLIKKLNNLTTEKNVNKRKFHLQLNLKKVT